MISILQAWGWAVFWSLSSWAEGHWLSLKSCPTFAGPLASLLVWQLQNHGGGGMAVQNCFCLPRGSWTKGESVWGQVISTSFPVKPDFKLLSHVLSYIFIYSSDFFPWLSHPLALFPTKKVMGSEIRTQADLNEVSILPLPPASYSTLGKTFSLLCTSSSNL